MRATCSSLLLLLCLVAVAAAPAQAQEAPMPPMLELSIEPFEGPAAPLEAPVVATMTARVSCLMLNPSTGTPVSFEVVGAPAWVTATVSPATATAADASSCDGDVVTVDAELIVTATEQAPAFLAAPIRVVAHAGSEPREATAEASTNVTATYFAIMDVQLPTPIVKIAPGDSHEFVLTVTNLGNDRTRVQATLVDATEGIEVVLPDLVELGSKQVGDQVIASEMRVRVSAPAADGFINQVNQLNVRLLATHADGESTEVDESTVSFVVTVQSFASTEGEDKESRIPGLAAPPVLAALVALALALRRTR